MIVSPEITPSMYLVLCNAIILSYFVSLWSDSCDDLLGSGLSQDNNNYMCGLWLWLVQFYASLVKRVHYTKGALIALVVQNLLPLLLVLVSLFIAKTLLTVPEPPNLELSPHLFFAKAKYNYMFVGGTYNNLTAPMVDSIFQPCGVSAHAVGSAADSCYQQQQQHTTNTPQQQEQWQCPAKDYPQVQYNCGCESCMVGNSPEGVSNRSVFLSSGVPVCYNGTVTGSRVLDVTHAEGEAEVEDLLKYIMRSTNSFVEERYGGVSFGHVREDVERNVDELNADSNSTLPFLASRGAAKAWYSLTGYHAMPAYLNTLNNAILRGSLDETSTAHPSEYGETSMTKCHLFHIVTAQNYSTMHCLLTAYIDSRRHCFLYVTVCIIAVLFL